MKFGKEYIFTVLVAAIICGCITVFFKEKTGYGKLIKMLCGLFMAITVISPWTNMDFSHLLSYGELLRSDGEAIVTDAQRGSREKMAAIISEECEAYILDKAKQLGLQLEISVALSEDAYPMPEQIQIRGSISPYKKSKLASAIETDLGIPKEQQIWIS